MRKNHLTAQELEELVDLYSSEVRKLSYQLQQNQSQLDELKKQYEKASKAKPKTVAKKAPAKTGAPKGRRGRPRKVVAADNGTTAGAAPKRRGRPKKVETTAVETAPKRRGRPKKVETTAVKTAPKRRGRPKKVETTAVETAPKRRGRPKKVETTAVKTAPKVAKTTKGIKKTAAKPKTTSSDKNKGYRLSEWDTFILKTVKSAKRVLISSELMKKAKSKAKRDKLEISDQALNGKLNRSIHKLANVRGSLVKVDHPGKGNAYGLPEWTDEDGKIREEYMK